MKLSTLLPLIYFEAANLFANDKLLSDADEGVKN